MSTATVPRGTQTTVPRLWPGETVVILGGGPSLTQVDVDYCRGRARVIAIKEAYHLAPWADALYACDANGCNWWDFEKGVPEFAGLKYAIEPLAKPWPGVQVLRNTGQHGLELDPTGIRTGYNSGYQAVNVAYHLIGRGGRIVLLGFDMWCAPDGRQNWFEGRGIAKSHHLKSPHAIFMAAFQTLAEPIKAAGVEVVNCSRQTLLRAFPQLSLEEALP